MTSSVVVPDRLAGHVQKGHPWLYADVLPPGPPPGVSGDFVRLTTRDGRPLGWALLDADSPIALRVVTTRKSDLPDLSLWTRRIVSAFQLRASVIDLKTTTAWRLLHGEGDFLPGVVVDRYGPYAVLKLDTAAWLPHLELLTRALVDGLKECGAPLEGIYLKGANSEEEGEDTAPRARPAGGGGRLIWGEMPPTPVEVLEYGMRFAVDVVRGQKTGLFLDQRENRALIRRVARGRDTLNLFSYTGGFSLAAALGGASRVTSVDISAGAIEGARLNFSLNGLPTESHEFVAADCFDFLGECASRGQQFDLMVVDPPSFAPREKAVRKALHAYGRLTQKALKQVRPGGLLASSSCSSHIEPEAFLQMIRESAAETRRRVRVLEVREAGADHPVPIHFPEGRYLKFVLMAVDG